MELERGFAFLPAAVLTRLDTLQRDVSMLLRDLTGNRAPTFSQRVPLARHKLASDAPSTRITPRPMRVARVVRETKDAVSLWLADVEGRRISFAPGQFLTVLVALPSGEVLRRAYSISSLPDDDGAALEVRITIKRLPGGVASNHLNDAAREGQILEILGPSGSFTAGTSEGAPRHLVLLAGGSGITPLAGIARVVLTREPGSRVSLVFGNRGEDDIIYRAELDALVAEHRDRFVLRNVLSSPPAGFTGTVGVLDQATVGAEIDALADLDLTSAELFVCGPEPMMAAAREALVARGVALARIREERFSAPARRPAAVSAQAPQLLRFRRPGKPERELVASAGQTILEAGLSASLPMPFSCTMGGCGACKVRLLEGSVASEEPNCLSDEERQSGLVLACVSRATSACRIEVP